MASSIMPLFIILPGYKGIIWGTEKEEEQAKDDGGPNNNNNNNNNVDAELPSIYADAANEPRSDGRNRRSVDAMDTNKINLHVN